ncbi:MAG: hypothetical protein QOG53_3282 [Frankiales bacterium]|nr:hypothetical protein [Frankiales bacterium]
MVTLFVFVIIAAIVGAIILAAGGVGPRVIRRTTVVDRPVERVVERPARRVVEEVEPARTTRRYVEE